MQVCCAAVPNRAIREEAIKVIDTNESVNYFILVFKGELGRRDIKATYSYDPNDGEGTKYYGPVTMPNYLSSSMFDSGANDFKPIECKTFIAETDADTVKVNSKIY